MAHWPPIPASDRTGRRYGVILPIDVAAFDSPGDRHELFLSGGIGLLVRLQSFGFSAFHLNVSSQLLSERDYRGASFGDRLGAEAVLYLAAGKFRVSIRSLAPAVRPALRGRRWMGSIGAADVNGMLYWIAKR